MDLKGKKVTFLGDSIGDGAGASVPENSFVALFSAAHKDCKVENFSIGGTRIANQLSRRPNGPYWDESPFYSRVEQIDPEADIVFIMGGTNDYGHGDAPMGKKGMVLSTNNFYGAMITTVLLIQSRCPNAQVVIATPIHRFGEDDVAVRPDGEWTLKDYVEAEKAVAEYLSVPVLDLWSISGIQPNVHENYVKYTSDGLHPNDLGHRKFFECIDKFVKTL